MPGMDGRGAVDELTFLLARVAIVAVPAGIGYAAAGKPGAVIGLVVGLVAAGAFWSWSTASGARAAARSDLTADADADADLNADADTGPEPPEPPAGEGDGRQVRGPD